MYDDRESEINNRTTPVYERDNNKSEIDRFDVNDSYVSMNKIKLIIKQYFE